MGLFDNLPPSRLILFRGLGASGRHIKALYERLKQTSVRYLIVEEDEVHSRRILKNPDFVSMSEDPRVGWVVACDREAAYRKFWDYFDSEAAMMASASVLKIDAFAEEKRPVYDELAQCLQSAARDRLKTVGGDPEDNYRGLRNILRHRPFIEKIPLFDGLKGLFAGRPGLVVSSGPSLTKSLPFLRSVQDRAVLFCVDSALKLLLREGVRPHFVACLERVPETARLFDGIKKSEGGFPWLVANPLVVPETLEAYPGPKLYFLRDASHLSCFFPKEAIHDMGASSSHMAYWGLHVLGCDPIGLAGQDLAFARNASKTHADGIAPVTVESAGRALAAIKKMEPVCGDSWTEGNNGEPILSWCYYLNFIRDFTRLIGRSGKTCLNIIPASEGARIPGARRVDPAEGGVLLSVFSKTSGLFEAVRERLGGVAEMRPVPSFDEHVREAIAFLAGECIPEVLSRLDEISHFYQYHLPSGYRPSFEKEYFDFFARLERKDGQLAGRADSLFQRLIAPYSWHRKILASHRISQAMDSDGPYEHKIDPVVDALTDYYHHLLLWAARTKDLLERSCR